MTQINDDKIIDTKSLSEKLQFAALVFTFLAPCLLTAGYSFYLGYINTFGLDSSLLNRGFSEAVTETWVVGIKFLTLLWSYKHYALIWAAIVFVLMLYCVIIVVKRRKLGLNNFLVDGSLNKENQGPEYFGVTAYRWGLIATTFYEFGSFVFWPIAILCAALFVCLLPFKYGADMARNSLDKYEQHQCSSSESSENAHCVSLVEISSDGRVLVEGLLITASKSHIALYSEGMTEVWPVRDDLKVVRTYKPLID